MPFDGQTRNRLGKLVGDVRTLLTDEFVEPSGISVGIDPGLRNGNRSPS